MSANVWFEEVSTGLIAELKKTVKIKNANGVLSSLPDSAFVVRKPEEDLKLEVLPCVSIYNKGYHYDSKRYDPIPVVVNTDTENRKVTLEETAIPFELDYQIDFWADYQIDMDVMTRTWLYAHYRAFNLPVVDDGGNERTCNCIVSKDIVKSDLVKNTKRLYHSIINLRIWVELDEEIRYNEDMISDTAVNVSND